MQIFVDKMEFSKAITKVERAIDNLKQYHNEQQKAFQELISSWKGRGGDSFSECSSKISDEAIMGIYVTTSLNNQIKTSLDRYNEEESEFASAISRGEGI